MASRIERVVGDTTVASVHSLLAEGAAAAAALERALHTTEAAICAQQQPLGVLLAEGGGFAANLRAATDSAALLAMRGTAHATLAQLERATARLDTASVMMLGVLEQMSSGQGSLGLLASDPALYARAVGTLDSLERLISDVRENPRRYINVRVF